MNDRSKRLVVGLSGASGVILGIRTLEVLRQTEIETHLIISPAARATIAEETDIGAAIASGSFATLGMIVIPCSIKTLSAVANSFASDLLSRAADVTLKEGRPLILVVRETPLHSGHLRLMSMAAQAGSVIYPPVPAFYTRPASMADIIDDTVGRVLARIGIENDIYSKWKEQ
jgi:4-hydroxy-3-polyprenylbenzoate decarboxylase